MKNIHGMSPIILLIVFAAAFMSRQAAAIVAPDTKQIKVIIAPSVLKKVKAAKADEREKLEAAIQVGNQFMPLHLSGQAYDTAEDNEDWTENTKPLIALSREKWADQWESSVHARRIQFGKEDAYVTRLTCSRISLIGIERDDEKTTLLYRTISLGMEVNYRSFLFDFNTEGAGTNYDLRIELNPDNLVTKVIYPDELDAQAYVGDIAFLNRILADHSRVGANPKEMQNEMFRTYPIFIRKLEKQAALVCK